MMTRKIAVFGLCALALAAAAPAVAAEKGKGIIGARQHLMGGVAGNLNAIKSILTEDPGQIALVPGLASAIAAASPTIPAFFPEGSMDDTTTTALPAIWERAAEFETASLKLEELALALAETAKGGDAQATMAAFGTMGKEGCGGCHENFRKKKE